MADSLRLSAEVRGGRLSGSGRNGTGMSGSGQREGRGFVEGGRRPLTYPQMVTPVSRHAVLAASEPPDATDAGLETHITAALESGATEPCTAVQSSRK